MTSVSQRRQLLLLDLPAEILVKILVNLAPKDLLRAKLVASPLYRLVREHVYLRYAIECHRHGVVNAHPARDVPPASYRRRPWTTAQKLDRLLERERNWDELESPSSNFLVAGPSPIYELQPSVYVRGADYVPAPGSSSNRPTALEVYTLPSVDDTLGDDGVDDERRSQYRQVDVGRQTLHFDVGPYLDLSLDPTQNLVVIIKRHDRSNVQHQDDCPRSPSPEPSSPPAASEPADDDDAAADDGCCCGAPSYELHLFGMDGVPRRDLPSSVLLLEVADPTALEMNDGQGAEPPAARFLIQICGDTLGVMVGGASDGERNLIHCWNWRTGDDICTHEYLLYDAPAFHYTSFLLLNPTAYVLTYLPPSSSTPSLQVFSVAHGEARLVSTLELPALNPTIVRLPIPLFFELRPDPPSSASERIWGLQHGGDGDGTGNGDGGFPPCGSTRPFATDPDRGVLNLDVTVGDSSYQFHVLKETLMQELAWGGDGRLRTWDEWGPKATRAWQGVTRRQWVTHIHGYRLLQVFPSSAPPVDGALFAAREVRLFDFNPLHFPDRAPSAGAPSPVDATDDDDRWHFNIKPNFIFKRQIWQHDVETELPFRTAVVSSLASDRSIGVMIDEERIITTLSANNGSDWHFVVQPM